ncbi:40S ribosomal protein S2 [Culex quinquefasciatus]|uniref:Small ribosomal subunit protein uS5 n=1 Tax=Culex quinquefasciatus TaxID=7176 RepID=B0WLY2_CULQU|nr:40S ribosomal protein S2 [Culex quinquefasciatus]|eukprot:XP_001849716.1 40S ribosomal protein S2 [Culex quinquefasciatus]
MKVSFEYIGGVPNGRSILLNSGDPTYCEEEQEPGSLKIWADLADAAPARGGFRGGFGSRDGAGDGKIRTHGGYTRAGQRTPFKAFIAIGDSNGHIGLGVKCSKEVATAIDGAIILAKLSVMPVRRGYWSNKIGKPHTVPCKIFGKCGPLLVRLIPARRGTGIVLAPVPKKLLQMAADCYTLTRGSTTTLGNFATAIVKTYAFLTPNLWKDLPLAKTPYQEYVDILENTSKTGQRIIELITANKNNASDLHG